MTISEREGQRFGNYRLHRLLGKGSFADVYLGEHLYLKTSAAIKMLHTSLNEQDEQLACRQPKDDLVWKTHMRWHLV